MSKENCVGCIVNIDCLDYSSHHICPCSICLVKSMCANTCEEYNVYIKVVYPQDEKIQRKMSNLMILCSKS